MFPCLRFHAFMFRIIVKLGRVNIQTNFNVHHVNWSQELKWIGAINIETEAAEENNSLEGADFLGGRAMTSC